MIAPPKLKAGDKIAIVSPGRWPEEGYVTGLVAALKRHGLEPVIDPQALKQSHTSAGELTQLAGEEQERADAFNKALHDTSIKGIFFPRAGTGSYQILDKIDYDAAARNPKIIIGHSDVDILLASISQRSKLITFRGPLGVNFASNKMDSRTETECFELLMGTRDTWSWKGITALEEGVAEGELIGANLAVLNANIGTPFEVDTKNKIFMVEECDELLFRLDRFLYQASAAGKLDASAVLFGTAENMLDGEQHDGSGNKFGKTISEMLRRWVPGNVPLAYGLPIGHAPYLSSHPIGAPVRVTIKKDTVEMKLLAPVVSWEVASDQQSF